MRKVTILILGLLISQISFSQSEFRFGLKGAANIGWITPGTKNIENGGSKLGWAYGIMGDYYFKPNYGLSVELLMSQINGKIELTEAQTFNIDTTSTVVTNMTYTYDLQYMEIPISMKFRTKEIGNVTYWGNFGFSPSFLIKAKASIAGTLPIAVTAEDPNKFNVNDDEGDDFTTNNFDDRVFLFRFPLIIGGGIEYKMAGSTSLQAGLRFTNSFTDILVKDKNVNAKNNYLAISVGVLF